MTESKDLSDKPKSKREEVVLSKRALTNRNLTQAMKEKGGMILLETSESKA